jgi:hypothetical protein
LIGILLAYFSGFWDGTIKPVIFPKHVEKYTFIGAKPVDAESAEFFVVINDYQGFADEEKGMTKYAMKLIYDSSQTNPEIKTMNLMVYFILHAEGSAKMRRKRALAVLRYEGIGRRSISFKQLAR